MWISLFIVLSCVQFISSKVDFRQTETNKAFVAKIPAGDFEVVHPFQIRDKNERIGIDTRNYFLKANEHFQHVTIVIRSSTNGRLKLVLDRNNYIFLNQTRFLKLDNNGEHRMPNKVENCFYQGTIAGDPNSFVALSSCNGLRGVMAFSNGSTFGIWPLDGGDRSRRHPHILYKTEWSMTSICGANLASAVANSQHHRRMARHLHERERRDLSKQTKYVELALIGDYEFMKQQGSSEDEGVMYMLEAVNIADLMLSRDLNIRLSVVYSETWMDVQRIDLFEDSERTLTGVIDYAAGHIYNIGKDASIVFTGGSFAGDESMNSAFRSICTARSASIVKAVDPYVSHWSGQLVAQSIGHLLGLEHDTPSCNCEMGNRCVMNAQPGNKGAPFAWQFSKCSVARMHGVWQAGQVHCLLNRPFQISELRECGNGIVDGSEECDCGSREECVDPCCDPLTCTLRAHAQCAAHQKCCHRCELRRSGEICRASRSTCDVAEVCDGRTGDCPADGHLIDGTLCGENGQCWRGNCSDPQAQCRQLWGQDARVAEAACFDQNTFGHEYANCGTGTDGVVRACQREDAQCGTLHCQLGAAIPSQSSLKAFTFHFPHEDTQVQCKAVADSQYGLMADGSKCGSGRVCVAGSCLDMASVSAPVSCPSNNHALTCSGHGECTTTLLCVCSSGWAGTACDVRTNSTNMKNRGESKHVVLIPSLASGKSLDTATLLGILLLVGVSLLLLLVCLLFCYRRRSVIEIPKSSDEKMDDSLPDETTRSIKFGNMPSYREEKRKRKSNKKIYGALNKITELDERDSASLRSRESGSQNAGSQLLCEPRAIPSSRSDVGVGSCHDRNHEHIYAESAIGIGYRNDSPMSRRHNRDRDLYGENSPRYELRPFPTNWREHEAMSPSGSSHLSATPLRLNNIGQILRGMHDEEEEERFSEQPTQRILHHHVPMPSYHGYEPRFANLYGGTSCPEDSTPVDVDHEIGSNTESSRGYEQDSALGGSISAVTSGEKWGDQPENCEKWSENGTASPQGNQKSNQANFEFRQSPSLFSDPFKLEMSSSIHT